MSFLEMDTMMASQSTSYSRPVPVTQGDR